jgi:hypothetical protein
MAQEVGGEGLGRHTYTAAAAALIAVAAAAVLMLRAPLERGVAAGTADPGPPTIMDVQAAYDRAALAARELHDKDLKIVGVDCHPGTSGRYTCEVGFVKTDYDRTRVFLDAALVERSASKEWTLLRGLCRRLL